MKNSFFSFPYDLDSVGSFQCYRKYVFHNRVITKMTLRKISTVYGGLRIVQSVKQILPITLFPFT